MAVSDLEVSYLANRAQGKVYRDGTAVLYLPHAGGKRSLKYEQEQKTDKKTKKKRLYTIDKKKVRSACIELWKRKKGKFVLFITVTFPGNPTEKQTCKVWDAFLDNLRKTYGITQYVWVKEYQKRGVIHYHILLDTVFIDIVRLQRTFNRICFNQGIPVSNNSVRLGNQPRVFGVKRIKNYLSKYMAKTADRYDVFEGRAYDYSNFFQLYEIVDFPTFIDLVSTFKGVKVWECHFSEVYRLSDEFLYRNYS